MNDDHKKIAKIHKQAFKKMLMTEQDSLYSTFVQPFADVVSVTKLVAQDVLAASLLNLKLWWSLSPKKQKEAFAKYDATKKEIDTKLRPLMDKIDANLTTGDADLMAMVLAPHFFFAQAGFGAAYAVAEDVTDFLDGAGLKIPLVSSLFDGKAPAAAAAAAPAADKPKGILGQIKTLFFGENFTSSLPIIVEQNNKKQDKPPFETAMKQWMQDSGVGEVFEEAKQQHSKAMKEYLEEIENMVMPILDVTKMLISAKTDSPDEIMAIVNKAKEVGLPGADQFEQKLQAIIEKIAEDEQFEKTADELAQEKPGNDGATEQQDEEAAEDLTIAEFLADFKKSAAGEDGIAQLQKQALQAIEEIEPDDFNKQALNTTAYGKEYLATINATKQKIADAFQNLVV